MNIADLRLSYEELLDIRDQIRKLYLEDWGIYGEAHIALAAADDQLAKALQGLVAHLQDRISAYSSSLEEYELPLPGPSNYLQALTDVRRDLIAMAEAARVAPPSVDTAPYGGGVARDAAE